MKIISTKWFLPFSVLFGISLLGYSWFHNSSFSEAQMTPQSVRYSHNGEQMTLTRILAADRSADTGNKACAKLIGANGQPMVCKNNVESFPYLGDKGCKQFYPNAAEFVSTYPGHGAHGGNYDILCLANSPLGDGGTCSGMAVNTCTTCPQCAKNLDCNEAISAPSNFADGVIVRCFDGPDVPVDPASLSGAMVLKMTFDNRDAIDSSGQNNHGTEQGGVGYTSAGCKVGSCAQFDGQNDTIFANNVYDLPGDMAVMTWVKVPSGQTVGARIIDTPRIDGVGVSMYFDTGRIVLDNGGGPNSVLPTDPGFENNQWHHVAAVRSGTSYLFYVDGNHIGTRTGTKPAYKGYRLAQWSNGGTYMKGALDEVYVFSRALTAAEVRQVRDYGVESPAGAAPTPSQSLPPVVDSTEVNGSFLTEVKGNDTGNSACAKFNKVCVGPSTFNREACLDFYPHAATKNATVGPQSEHFCKAGSTADVCAGTTVDTCVMAVSSSQQMTCDSFATNVDSFFVECEDPSSPQILEEVGGTFPPLSPPEVRLDGSGYVDYTVTVHHPQQFPTQVRIEYSIDNGASYQNATLVSVGPSEGTVDLSNSNPYQIGSTDSVDTDQYDSVVLDFVWDAVTDGVDGDEVILRITVQDAAQNTTTDMTSSFPVETGSHGSTEEISNSFGHESEQEPVDTSVQIQTGRSREDAMENCFVIEEDGETSCQTNQEITEFLDALVRDLIQDGDLSEKEKAKSEFIKRYLALQNNGLSLEEKLKLFDHGMTRGEAVEMAVFLLSSHGVIFENGGLPLDYTDISRSHPYAQAIAYGTAYGIVEGYPDGSFQPDQAPNLAEMARIVVRSGALIKNSVQDTYAQEVLKDGKSDWFIPYVKTLRAFGISVPIDYEGLGEFVSGLRFLDMMYDLLLRAGVEKPFPQV